MNGKHILLAAILFSALYLFTENARAGFASDCAPCHGKLGQFTTPHTDEDCKSCHNWAARHIVPNICTRCHSSNIHETHKNRAECDLCHNPPANFSSSIVKIPYAANPEGITIPSSKECTYCHDINTGGSSLHEIHGSRLSDICSGCHLTGMSGQSVTKVLSGTKKPANAEITILEDLFRLFNEIARIIASIFGA